MNNLFSRMGFGTAVLLGAAIYGFAQSPPELQLELFAGINIAGIPGEVYVVQSSSNPADSNSWSGVAFVQLPSTNYLFVDTTVVAAGNRFYRAVLRTPPANMVFVPPGTFTMAVQQMNCTAGIMKARKRE